MIASTLLLLLSAFLLLSPLLVHEAAHWAALRAYGHPVQHMEIGVGPQVFRARSLTVRLFPLAGGVTLSTAFEELPWRQRFVTALAGPLASSVFASALLLGALSLASPQQEYALFRIGLLSLFLCVFNLVPLPCLDGFHAARALADGFGFRPKGRCHPACSWKWLAALALIAIPAFWLCVESWT